MREQHERREPRHSLKRILDGVCLFVCVFMVVFGVLSAARAYNSRIDREEIGIKAVNLLYNFGSYEELAGHQMELQQITSEEVYNQLTFDNEERTMYTYLKFKGESSRVEILRSSDSYVFYTLHSPSLVSGRKFLFLFDVDSDGKLSYVREEECIDFVERIKTDY